jgi:hypothetical protein
MIDSGPASCSQHSHRRQNDNDDGNYQNSPFCTFDFVPHILLFLLSIPALLYVENFTNKESARFYTLALSHHIVF